VDHPKAGKVERRMVQSRDCRISQHQVVGALMYRPNRYQKYVLIGGAALFMLSIAVPPYVVGIPGFYELDGVDWDSIDGYFRGRKIIWSGFAVEQIAIWCATLFVFLHVRDKPE